MRNFQLRLELPTAVPAPDGEPSKIEVVVQCAWSSTATLEEVGKALTQAYAHSVQTAEQRQAEPEKL
ncbi:hypothetical protein [Longimicrobium sp.]|jgi:hypothetical protein|uniref:hypothetical protein n=1 Tax=Longimicrobium sp. TaxID=2029185 RepID=UPI002ED912A5